MPTIGCRIEAVRWKTRLDQADLAEIEREVVLQDRIDRRDDRLHEVVQQSGAMLIATRMPMAAREAMALPAAAAGAAAALSVTS